jgi:uncharacterized protein with von Willebrand factor type A (vWA) domain
LELPKHFIFVLDASGSMKSCWDSLLQAVRSFVELKLKTKAQNVEHTVSCIVFSSNAQIEFSQQSLATQLFDNIRFTHGGTVFTSPLRKVIELLDNCTVQSLNVVVFMTDGDAEYPTDELATLKKPEYWGKIDMFWAVLFGTEDKRGTLKKITQAFKGKGQYQNPMGVNDLISEYIEIAKLT